MVMIIALQLVVTAATVPMSPTDSLEALWERSLPFPVYLQATRDLTAAWEREYQRAAVPDSILARARGAGGKWRILVVTDVGCHDSRNSVPVLGRLGEAVSGIEVRVADTRAGRWLMDAHRTPDGRTATPTVIVLDASGHEAGWVVEYPGALRAYLSAEHLERGDADFRKRVEEWHGLDRGVSILAEVVGVMLGVHR